MFDNSGTCTQINTGCETYWKHAQNTNLPAQEARNVTVYFSGVDNCYLKKNTAVFQTFTLVFAKDLTLFTILK